MRGEGHKKKKKKKKKKEGIESAKVEIWDDCSTSIKGLISSEEQAYSWTKIYQ